MRIGGLTALGFGVGDLFRFQRLAADESKPFAAKAKACILVWLDGGPSHLETWDPKPDAPVEVRGPARPIATKLPGVGINEWMPRMANSLDRFALVRSVTSTLGEHNFGTHYLMTGHKPSSVLEYPTFGAVVAEVRKPQTVLPPHIAVPHFRVGGSQLTGAGYLADERRPFSVGGDPAKPNFQVRDLDFFRGLSLERLSRRRRFVNEINDFGRHLDQATRTRIDPDLERAYQLIASEEAKRAFNLSDEPDKIRYQRYGGRSLGQSCLLARRLVERGVPFVTVNHQGWDTHDNLYTRLKEGYTGAATPVGLVPVLDRALSGLVEDLQERGLLEQTLVVAMGEFGRTPKLNTAGGRDHWPRVFSVALAGGGIRPGQVIGASDAVGESPREQPVTPSDLAATIYSLLGIGLDRELKTADQRPLRITPEGSQIVRDLII